MKRRAFITLMGGAAAAWPLAARAQQVAMPVVGFVNDSEATTDLATAFRDGLSEAGLVEGRNVAIEYRWANSQYDQVPRLVGDPLRHQVAVIARVRANTAGMATDIQGAAATIGLQVEVLYAETVSELETALASAARRRAGALMIAPDALFLDRRAQIAALALHHGLPAIYVNRAFPEA